MVINIPRMTVLTDAQKSDTSVSKEQEKVLSTGAVQVCWSRIDVSRPIQWGGSSATADAEIQIKIPASNKRLVRLTPPPWGYRTCAKIAQVQS